jgi:hypothetical protein
MTKKYRSALVLFILFCLLSFYSYGTAMMDYFLLYPSRFIVGDKESPAYHKLLEVTIFPITVFPFVVIIILNAILLGFRPLHVSKNLLWISMICLGLDFLSTVFFQAPWNMQLSQGKNVELMQKITDTNWGRVFLESAQVIIVFLLLKQFVFRHAAQELHG